MKQTIEGYFFTPRDLKVLVGMCLVLGAMVVVIIWLIVVAV